MRVAWVTHHLPGERRGRGHLLPGRFAGGAEMTDFEMVAAAPAGVTVDWLPPSRWEDAADYDRVVVTGTDLLGEDALRGLAELRPVVWVHHKQSETEARAQLFGMADPFVCMSDLHAAAESEWTGVSPEVCNGWIDLSDVSPKQKGEWALWAARDHEHKGRAEAREWAAQAGVELRELSSVPRAEVLAAMAEARWFVFLPTFLDACPRTLIEAEASGCEIVTNGLAGRRLPGSLSEVMGGQRDRLWGWVVG
ncbi:MAG TPA: hypothetical protein VIG24_17985 [Acidimicrobiia bacterium]